MEDLNPIDISEMTVESLLGSLGLDVMKDNMEQQIHGTIESQQNFLSIVVAKFNDIIVNTSDNDTLRQIKEEMIDFCRDLINQIISEYNLYFDADYNTEGSMEYIEILSVLYNFFVLGVKQNVIRYLIGHIENNKNEIINTLGLTTKILDITTIANKKKNINKENICILSNVDKVINFIANVDIDPFEFLNEINDGDYYTVKLIEYMQSNIVGGNFVNQYITRMIDDYSSPNSTEVRNSVRLAFK